MPNMTGDVMEKGFRVIWTWNLKCFSSVGKVRNIHTHTKSYTNHLEILFSNLIGNLHICFKVAEGRAIIKSTHSIRPYYVLLLQRRTQAPAVSSSHTSGVYMEPSFPNKGQWNTGCRRPLPPTPNLPPPASTAMWIMDHYSSTPGSMNHPCIMAACGRLGVHWCLILSPRWKHTILFWLTILFF